MAEKEKSKIKSTKLEKRAKSSEKLWGGRFEGKLSEISQIISESISFDKNLFEVDIVASLAHAKMLNEQKIISDQAFANIEKGLDQVLTEYRSGQFEFRIDLEDVHTHIEARLVELVGDDGKRLHTARSRNDQVAVDTRLYLLESMQGQFDLLLKLLTTIVDLAEKNHSLLWAGYTHTQIAQPVTLGHYLMNYYEKFYRDFQLLSFAFLEADQCPLGSAALAGANYPINRERTAELLNFSNVTRNSMDAVSNRDYQLSYHFFATRFFSHVSQFCEDMILYSSSEFGYVVFDDTVTTGSSIMPQKKNPDIAELLRGKSARVMGNLTALLMNLKGLPMTYNRDLQEDKVYLFDTVNQVFLGIKGITELLQHASFKVENVFHNLQKGFAQATDIADYLVYHYGISFRESHEITGKLVRYCELHNKTLGGLTEQDIQLAIGNQFQLPATLFDLNDCLSRKQGTGSTAPKNVKSETQRARLMLQKIMKDMQND